MLNLIFNKLIPIFLFYYERHFMYRIKRSWGIANLRKIKNIGSNVMCMGYTRFIYPEKIILEDNVRIGYGCFFYGKGGIKIGKNSILSRYITIYSSNHDFKAEMIPYSDDYIDKEVVIGEGVWIGMGVSITPGVTIGDGAIIGMGAVISRDIEKGEIVVGSGQRVISKRDMDEFYRLTKENSIYSVKYPLN